MQVIVAALLSGGFTKNMSWVVETISLLHGDDKGQGSGSLRYFELRTNLPAILAHAVIVRRNWDVVAVGATCKAEQVWEMAMLVRFGEIGRPLMNGRHRAC